MVRNVPGLGQIYSVACAIAGRDFISGEKLTGAGRWLSMLGSLGRGTSNLAGKINAFNNNLTKLNDYAGIMTGKDFLNGGRTLSLEERLLGGLSLARDNNLGSLTDVARKAGDTYNKLIESKYYQFGTGLTGKDLWGNNLNWNERQAGINTYLRNSDWNFDFNQLNFLLTI